MSSWISDEKKIIFIHLPKTAGTSIEKILSSIETFHPLRDNMYSETGTLWDSLQEHDKTIKRKVSSYRVFCSVRHPVDRFISAYNDFTYTRIDKRYMKQYKGKPISTTKILRQPIHIQKIYRRLFYHGLIPLTDHLPPLKYLDYVISVENFDRDLRQVFETLGLPQPKRIPHVNKSKHVFTKLTKYDVQLIRERFKRDYEVFGYD